MRSRDDVAALARQFIMEEDFQTTIDPTAVVQSSTHLLHQSADGQQITGTSRDEGQRRHNPPPDRPSVCSPGTFVRGRRSGRRLQGSYSARVNRATQLRLVFHLLPHFFERAPSKEEILVHHQAGLGRRTVHMDDSVTHEQIISILKGLYPALSTLTGGFLLYRACGGSGRRNLSIVPPGDSGYTSHALSRRFSVLYVVPTQEELSTDPLPVGRAASFVESCDTDGPATDAAQSEDDASMDFDEMEPYSPKQEPDDDAPSLQIKPDHTYTRNEGRTTPSGPSTSSELDPTSAPPSQSPVSSILTTPSSLPSSQKPAPSSSSSSAPAKSGTSSSEQQASSRLPSSSRPIKADPLPSGGCGVGPNQQVAHLAAQSLQQQQASRTLLGSVSQSLEILAQSVQLLVETQQEFVQESLMLQRETVDVLRDFSNTALTMLRESNQKSKTFL